MIDRYNIHVLNPQGELKVALVKTTKEEIDRAVYDGTRAVIELLLEHDTDFRKFAQKLEGKTALVKPNLTKHPPTYSPHNKMTTDPFAVKSVVDWLLEQGVEKVYVGECNSWGTEIAYKLCGYYDVFSDDKYRDKITIIDLRTRKKRERDYINYKMKEDVLGDDDIAYIKGYIQARHATLLKFGKSKKVNIELALSTRFGYNKLLKEIDLLVNVAKLKTQVQTVASLSVKNLFGLLEPIRAKHAKHLGLDPVQEDISRRELIISYVNLSRSLAAFASAISSLGFPILHLVEGGIAMEGNGPLEHGIKRIDKVVAGAWRHAATLDAVVSTQYMRLSYNGKPYIPYHVALASYNGLGSIELDNVSLILAHNIKAPKSIEDLNDKPFEPPATVRLKCAPTYTPGETLLDLLERCIEEFRKEGIDPDEPVTVIEEKMTPEVVLKEF
mgnify:CR=1 FL=1